MELVPESDLSRLTSGSILWHGSDKHCVITSSLATFSIDKVAYLHQRLLANPFQKKSKAMQAVVDQHTLHNVWQWTENKTYMYM